MAALYGRAPVDISTSRSPAWKGRPSLPGKTRVEPEVRSQPIFAL